MQMARFYGVRHLAQIAALLLVLLVWPATKKFT